MSAFERFLVPGSTEKPTCRCGDVMEVASIDRLPEGSDAAIRVLLGRGSNDWGCGRYAFR
jgi:hypothetical protein